MGQSRKSSRRILGLYELNAGAIWTIIGTKSPNQNSWTLNKVSNYEKEKRRNYDYTEHTEHKSCIHSR